MSVNIKSSTPKITYGVDQFGNVAIRIGFDFGWTWMEYPYQPYTAIPEKEFKERVRAMPAARREAVECGIRVTLKNHGELPGI